MHAALGATVLEDTQVVDAVFEGERCVGFTYTKAGGGPATTVRASLVVDASGQSTLLARKHKWIKWDEQLKNIAVWAYYQGGLYFRRREKREHPDRERFGWLDLGYSLCMMAHIASDGLLPCPMWSGRENLEQTFLRIIDKSVDTRRLLASATRVSGFRTARDWSYQSKQFYGPGFLLVGDAATFVDPLFSAGIFLAMNSANMAARIIDSVLKQPEREQELFELLR